MFIIRGLYHNWLQLPWLSKNLSTNDEKIHMKVFNKGLPMFMQQPDPSRYRTYSWQRSETGPPFASEEKLMFSAKMISNSVLLTMVASCMYASSYNTN